MDGEFHMSDPGTHSPVVVVPPSKPPLKNVELILHALIVVSAIICLTILASEKLVSGDTVANLIIVATGVNGLVTGVKTLKNGG